MDFTLIILSIIFAHYFFLIYKLQYTSPLVPDCAKCQINEIEDTQNHKFDGRGVIQPFQNQYKPRRKFNPDYTGNVIGRFERFNPNQKQSDNELVRFVQMNSLQRLS